MSTVAKTKEWVAWGVKYVSDPIRLTGGTLAHCRSEIRTRKQEGGWTGLALYPEGAPYPEARITQTPDGRWWQVAADPHAV